MGDAIVGLDHVGFDFVQGIDECGGVVRCLGVYVCQALHSLPLLLLQKRFEVPQFLSVFVVVVANPLQGIWIAIVIVIIDILVVAIPVPVTKNHDSDPLLGVRTQQIMSLKSCICRG